MFEAKLDDISLLRDSIATVAELIDETELHIKEYGIQLIASDRAVVVVVDFYLARDVFTEYKYTDDARIGINLQNLLQILKRAGEGDSLTIKMADGKLDLTLKGVSTRKFVLPLIDISREETPPIDKLDFSSSLTVDSEILSSGIEDAELITDSVIFTVRKDQLTMKGESDSSFTQLDLMKGDGNLRITDMNEPVRARYSLDYLKKIIKAKKLSPSAKISMSNDYPMKIQFEVPGKMQLGFILAPRVEE
ncbi:MAG: proliferating cell nuclear antigen [archaeon GW2011_AR5]|nr:MAG: proliferating cell nuclear antigen [archaeon GW2011_AR5]